MKKFTSLLSLVLGVLTFVACDDTTSADNSSDFTAKVDTVYSVLKDTVFVMEKDTVVLDNRDTVVLNQRDTIVRLDTVARMDTVVLNKKDTLVLNHVDTVVVIDTVLGLNDDHCFVDNGFGANALIVCGEDSTWVSKVVCGRLPYNPNEQFCFGDRLYDLCGGKSYDPTQYACGPEEKLLPLCGTEGYHPETHFCFAYNKHYYVVKKCGGMAYVPLYHSCSEDDELMFYGADYRLVKQDSLLWMADNLKDDVSGKATFCGGGSGTSSLLSDHFIDGDCETYGRLYSYSLVKTLGDGLCPGGWRLPTIEELSAWIEPVIEASWKEAQLPGYVSAYSSSKSFLDGFLIWSGTIDDESGQSYGMLYNGVRSWENFSAGGPSPVNVYGSIRCVKKVEYTSDGLLY